MKKLAIELKERFQSYFEALNEVTEAEFNYKESEEIWSLAQMMEHVHGSGYTFFLANVNRCLEQIKGQIGGELTDAGSYIMYKNGFPPASKYKHPNHKKGTTPELVGKEVAHYKKEMPALLEALLVTIPDIEKDAGEYKTQHFVFGMMNAEQWLRNTEFHIRHHIVQMNELRAYFLAAQTS
jgi:hypothetical protein